MWMWCFWNFRAVTFIIFVKHTCVCCRIWLRAWCATAAPPTTPCWTTRGVCALTAGSLSSTAPRHMVTDTHTHRAQYMPPRNLLVLLEFFLMSHVILYRCAAAGPVLPGGRHLWWGCSVSYWSRSSSHRSEGCTMAEYRQWWYPLIISYMLIYRQTRVINVL